MPLCRTFGITGTRIALTWLEPNTASDVKRPNISRALTLRQWKSVNCFAVCVPVHTKYDNQLFPILPGYVSCHRQLVSCAPSHCQQYTELPSFRVLARVQPLKLGREGSTDHDIDTTITSGPLPWSLRCQCLPKILVLPWTELLRPRSCPNAQEKKKHRRMVERNEAPSRGQSERGSRWTKQAHVPLETSEDQRLVQAVPLLPKTQDAWLSFGQRHRRVRSAVLKRATLTLCSRAHGRDSPEMAGSGKLLLPLPMALHIPPNGTPIRRWQHIIAKRSCMFACPGTRSCSWTDSMQKKKNENWDRLTADRGQCM